MAGMTQYPTQYQLFSSQQTKQLNVVLAIDGLDTVFGVQNTYTQVRYGDPGIYYGEPGLVYGALRLVSNCKPYLMFDSGLTLSQRLEPEQGRGSISQMSFSLIDKDGYVTQVISPGGGILDDILGRSVVVRMGYIQTSYPEDYCVIFRGVITQVTSLSGRVNVTLGDANQKTRSATFKVAKATLTSAINASQLNIPVSTTLNFYDLIVNESPALFSNWTVKPYLKIDQEVIPYGFGAMSGATITALSRGGANARGTTAATHDSGAEVTNALEINGHPLTIALKLMLSGWGGAPWIEGVTCQALGTVIDSTVTPAANVICLKQGINADTEFGLVIGDKIQISGSSAGNNGTYTITGFGTSESIPNRLIYLNANLNYENPASGVSLAFYSQFDVYPSNAGLKLTPNDVDVKTHIQYRDQVFNSPEYFMRFYLTTQSVGKSWIESEIYLPLGAYSLTRYGRLSMGYMKPPVAADKLIVLSGDNLINPENITVTRGLNNRKFYNEIQYQYERNDAGNYEQVVRTVDTDSLNTIGILQLLPINSSGIKQTTGGQLVADRVSRRLLTRFKKAAFDVQVQAQWNPGTFLEAGDGVVLRDNGTLHLTNFATGQKDLGTQVFEVTNRTIDIKTGAINLTLTSSLDINLGARYGVIAPSSFVNATGSTTTQLRLKKSFGNTNDESVKWAPLVGAYIQVHSRDFTRAQVKQIIGLSAIQPDTLILDSALSFTPQENDLVDLAPYGLTSDATYNEFVKAIYAFTAPSLTVLGGLSQTQFLLSLADFAKVLVGSIVQIRSSDYSVLSEEVKVTGKTSPNTVTVETALGFTPSAGQRVEVVGFLDAGGAYRFM